MPYAPELKRTIDEAAAAKGWKLMTRPMFGGLAYFVANDNMCFAIMGKDLLFRVGESQVASYAKLPGVRPASMGKRVMKNWLLAGAEALADERSLAVILDASYGFALQLPANLR
jgi:hypothetical protein